MGDLEYRTAVHSEQHPKDDAADEGRAGPRDLDDIEKDEQALPYAPWMDQHLAGVTNPFVRSGLEIIRERGILGLAELCGLLARCEPLLSPLNQECAARESLRLAELWKPKPIASNHAAEDVTGPRRPHALGLLTEPGGRAIETGYDRD